MAEDRPSVSTLARIAAKDPENLQLHADKIVHLEFLAGESAHHILFREVKFPNLETLVLDASDLNDDESIEPYLQPSLTRLIFYGGPISDVSLEKLQNACPQLEELQIDNPRDLISPEGFLRFLDGAKSLKHLTVIYGMDRAITDSVFVALAVKPGIETLQFQLPITADLVSKAVDEQTRAGAQDQLFPQLRKVVCVGEPDGLLMLLPHFPQLTYLEASVMHSNDPSADVRDLLPDINANCLNLCTLKLEYLGEDSVHISSQTLVELAQGLGKLEELDISGDNIFTEGFDDSHFSRIVQVLPRLKVLQLSFTCDLTEASLVEAAKNCGMSLIDLEIGGSYDLQKLTKAGLRFPELQSLELGKLVPPSVPAGALATEAVGIARLLRDIAPNLEEFDVMSANSFSDMVENELDKM
ncbi:hypothetical protein F4804DRAFT_21741 [Jackrogersella minutella]|nr:hypothetical protein F4804DRAFT_21741 [Jackrogersella minutella]